MSNLSLAMPKTLDAAHQLAAGRSSRKLGHNTYLESSAIGACIVYHQTPIITLYPDSFTITNGGFFTRTTKDRLSRFLHEYGYGLTQVKGEWFYYSLHFKSVLVPYKNGDTKQMIADRFEQVNGRVH